MGTTTTLPEINVTATRLSQDQQSYITQAASFAGAQCFIEVYPFEGGQYSIEGGHISACSVTNYRNGNPGSFSFTLAPGGPNGTDASPTWSEVITPMSLVVIGMMRGAAAAIEMIGVVQTVGETQIWSTSSDGRQSVAQRGQGFSGFDFNYYFITQNYATLAIYGYVPETAFGAALGLPQGLNYPASMGQGLTDGSPAQLARQWYDKLMLGDGGIMGKSFVPYQPAGTRLGLHDIIKTIWEDYPAFVPFGASFIAYEGSWKAKFDMFLPAPFYEFFITTGPSDAYGETVDSGTQSQGKEFKMALLPTAKPASPIVVARVNPFPVLNTEATSAGGPITLGTVDAGRWNDLPLADWSQSGFYSSNVSFSADDARNAYFINITVLSPTLGINNANVQNSSYLFTSFGDAASIKRYGFRPQIVTTAWWFDAQGTDAQVSTNDVPGGIAKSLAYLMGTWHPLPLMARGQVQIPLQPDLRVGTRFRYRPFKNAAPGLMNWDFYIESVTHNFIFGGQSRTTLTLSRGLPQTVYSDTASGGLLENILKGNAQRIDGSYEVGIPEGSGPPLTCIPANPQSIADFFKNIGQIGVIPGL